LAIQNFGGVNADGGTITASIDGLDLHVFDVGEIDLGAIVSDSFSTNYIASTTGFVDVSFSFTRAFLNFDPVVAHYLDDVGLTASVPEPSALFLLLFGILGLHLFRRR